MSTIASNEEKETRIPVQVFLFAETIDLLVISGVSGPISAFGRR